MNRAAPGPIKVALVDLDQPVEGLSPNRAEGGTYDVARVVPFRAGRPLGMLDIPLGGSPVGPAELTDILLTEFGSGIGAAADTPTPDDLLPFATVIVPSLFARGDALELCAQRLADQDYPHYEVVIVDNRTTRHDPPDWAGRYPNVRVVSELRPGISAARNRGLDVAGGAIVACTDDDVEVGPGWLRALAGRLVRHPEEACVTGVILPSQLETAAQLWFEAYYGGFGTTRHFEPMSFRCPDADRPGRGRSPYRRGDVTAFDDTGAAQRTFAIYGAGTCGAGANMAFRTSWLRAHGGFDTRLGLGTATKGGEDLSAFIAVLWSGHSIGFEPRAVVSHTHRRDYPDLRSQIHSYGLGFSGMLTSLVVEDPSHLVSMTARLPVAALALAKSYLSKFRGHRSGDAGPESATFPSELARLELLGMLQGPAAYFRSRRHARRDGRRPVASAPTLR
jgi:hypothetical protein